MWFSDRAPASKPRQDIRSCWSGTLAMQHPDLKCSSGFVVICSSQPAQYRGASGASPSPLPPPLVFLSSFPITTVQSALPSLSLHCLHLSIILSYYFFFSLLKIETKTKLLCLVLGGWFLREDTKLPSWFPDRKREKPQLYLNPTLWTVGTLGDTGGVLYYVYFK